MDEMNNNPNVEYTPADPGTETEQPVQESRPTPPPVPPRAPQVNYTPPQYQGYPPYQPPYVAPQPPRQPEYFVPPVAPEPPKPTMSGAQKAFVAIAIALLAASLAAFISFLAFNGKQSIAAAPQQNQPIFQVPTEAATLPQEAEPEGSQQSYPESDARDKTDKNYKGLTLEKKPKTIDESKYGSVYAYKSIEKSVVGIICYVDGQEGTADSYTGIGSGIVATEDGYIITNAHIVANSRTAYKIKVITNEGKEFKAGVVGFDSRTDLAVLKVDAKDLVPASFGDSADNEVSEDVIAVGNPRSLKYQNSVTKGIISAIDRQTSVSNISKLIQTDAAINPGNSGGPLCNMYGKVIGISSSKIVLESYESMAFAIPTATVKEITDQIIREGYVGGRVKIGITGEVTVIDERTGIEIKSIGKGGPLDGTGAQVGDIVISLAGKDVFTFADIYNELENHKAGESVELELYRPENEKTYKIQIKLQEDKSE